MGKDAMFQISCCLLVVPLAECGCTGLGPFPPACPPCLPCVPCMPALLTTAGGEEESYPGMSKAPRPHPLSPRVARIFDLTCPKPSLNCAQMARVHGPQPELKHLHRTCLRYAANNSIAVCTARPHHNFNVWSMVATSKGGKKKNPQMQKARVATTTHLTFTSIGDA